MKLECPFKKHVKNMPEYELIYFGIPGRAEPIRLCFHAAGVPFKDTRVAREDWPTVKQDVKKIPFGVMPVLLIDGKPLCESHTITRYVAKVTGLDGGPDPLDVAHIDQIYEMCRSFSDAVFRYLMVCLGVLQEDKQKLCDEVFSPNVEKHFNHIRSQLKPSGFFGDKVTYADIYWSRVILVFNKFNPEIIQKYPEFLEQAKKVNELPQLQDYLKSQQQA
ncbi:unnamed protein product [Bursaphelenchus xylophilus]|uniref:(pine wood nematode) hypothetical protein n=1 Tax=Bursaphelenchus xylophilus TaxID=6326 RepID=A0A1I7RQK2_BURXY|nr:unnamed protein product [Bursaphelenchus xylophilus]CAG9104719.1 unnamed protein product [Bursaphelenchus xylophilus]